MIGCVLICVCALRCYTDLRIAASASIVLLVLYIICFYYYCHLL